MAETRYINPCTDFGFKKLFGTQLNKDLLGNMRDIDSVVTSAEKEGVRRGRAEGAKSASIAIAQKRKGKNASIDEIAEL